MISFVTITFNNFDELVTTINSTQAIQNMPYENVVINGGACQKTRDYLAQNRHIVSLSEKDDGIADAFNKGIKLSSGDYIVFLNSGDAIADHSYFENAYQVFKKNPNVLFTHANVFFNDLVCGNIQMAPPICNIGRGMPYYHQTMIVPKDIFLKIGNFKTNYKIAMDYEWICRLIKNYSETLSIYYINLPAIHMDGAGISSTNEILSINECRRALKSNQLWIHPNIIFWYQRLWLFKLRRFIMIIGLKILLQKLKILKHSRRVHAKR